MRTQAMEETMNIPLSDLFTDPMLRRAFARAERDQGYSFAIPDAPEPELDGGAEAEFGTESVDSAV